MLVRHSDKTKRSVSILGFGGWQLGNTEAWGEMSFSEGKNLVRDAFARGITFYDTAPGYSNGLSEEIIGAGTKSFRQQAFINTKVGHTADGANFSVDSIESSVNKSLTRLETDYVDSVLLHNPPKEILENPIEYEREFNRLKNVGILKFYGVSIDSKEELRLVLDKWDVDVIEIMYNIFHQDVAELFDEVHKKGIMLIIKVPLDSGWLTGKYDKDSVFSGVRARWNRGQISRRADLVARVKDIIGEEDILEVALAFALKHPAVTTVIPGVKNKEQLKSNLNAVKYELSNNTYNQLQKFYIEELKDRPLGW